MLRLLLVLLVVLQASNVSALDVGLEDAVTMALREHPQSQILDAETRMAEAAAKEASSTLLPRVMLGESLYWTNEPGGSLFISLNQEKLVVSQDSDIYNHPPDRKDYVTRLELIQPLFDSDLWYGREQARQAAAAVKARAGFDAEQVAFAAFSAYLEVQGAEAALLWAETGQREAEELLALARAKQEAGVGLKAATLRTEVQRLQADQRLVSARHALILARERLAAAIGSEQRDVGISGALPTQRFQVELPDSLSQRGDLRALDLQLQQTETARRQSRAAYWPKAGLSADYSLHDDTPFGDAGSNWSVRANLSWELFDGLRRGHGSARALAAQQATRARKLDAEREARLAVRRADLQSVEAELELASSRLALAQAEESFRLYRERYEAGISSLADLLAVQSELERARFGQVEAELAWLRALGERALQRGCFVETALAGKENLQ